MYPNSEEKPARPRRFWPIFGLTLVAALALAMLYAVLAAPLTSAGLSNALCLSAALLGLASAVPVILDVGRGVGLAGKMGASREEHHQALAQERQRREQGMTFTFAIAAAAVVITLFSFVIALF